MMTIHEAIKILQDTFEAQSIEMTSQIREALEVAETCMCNEIEQKNKKKTPTETTFGQLLDLIDIDREGNDLIALMNNNGEKDLVGRVSSQFWEPFEQRIVNGFSADEDTVKVWLEDEEAET